MAIRAKRPRIKRNPELVGKVLDPLSEDTIQKGIEIFRNVDKIIENNPIPELKNRHKRISPNKDGR